ncbi:glycosyltransferase family 4 protein [uncultured Photobacterium sp.]|uniref:glycosyltransferase family 4 protein n=1 Tax=uncultured Photobacterium sp. TaxID=173973 RepID=UPI002624B0C3|nr:glycosyltransferase family 4 protein [uncultured Photobacterium sp.]
MKKIGYVIPSFPTLSETFVGVEMRAMMALGHQLQPYAFNTNEHFQPVDTYLKSCCTYLSEAPVYPLRNIWKLYRCHNFIYKQKGFSYLSLLRQGLQLAYLAKRDGCEHLHAHFAWHSAATAIVAAKLLNIPVSFVGHGADIYAAPQDLTCKLQAADFICAVTKEMQNELQLATTKPVCHIPCGIHEADYPPPSPHWHPTKDFLFIGRLVEKKGLDTLLNAFSLLPMTATLDIVGDGPLLTELTEMVKELGLNRRVAFHGSKDAHWYHHHAGDYKALVAPFTIALNGDKDTGPLVIKEAMALGLPVITSDLAGCCEILDDNSGKQVPMDDPYSLQYAMQQHLSLTPTELHQQRKHAFERVITLFGASRQACLLSALVEAQ